MEQLVVVLHVAQGKDGAKIFFPLVFGRGFVTDDKSSGLGECSAQRLLSVVSSDDRFRAYFG